LFESIRQTDTLGRAKKRSLSLVLSFSVHGLLIVAGVAASYWAAHHAADKAVKLTFFAPPPPPPPPPAGGGSKTKKTPKKTEIKPKKHELVQPKEIPKETPKEEPKEKDEPEEHGQEGGVKGGVEGGVVGGQVGGVVGGQLGGELGGKLSYERLSKAPKLLVGEKQPAIPGNLLPMLRGSKGLMYIKFRIRADGTVDSIEIIKSTIPLLDDIMKKHVLSWKFEPSIINGRAVAVEFSQPFSFVF
jgi:protein TonB